MKPEPNTVHLRATTASALALLLCLGAQPGVAQDVKSDARELFLQGVERADNEQWPEAVQSFRRSLALVERPSTRFNLGVALYRMGKYRESVSVLEQFLQATDPAPDPQAREKAENFMRQAETALATVELTVDPPSAVVHVDGERMESDGARREIRLDPGRHRIQVDAPGHVEQILRISLLSGSKASTEVHLVSATDADQRARKAESARRAQAAEAAVEGREIEPAAGQPKAEAEARLDLEQSLAQAAGSPTEPDEQRETGGGILSSPWLWVGAGVLLAGASIGLGVGLAGGGGRDSYGGSAGVVLRP